MIILLKRSILSAISCRSLNLLYGFVVYHFIYKTIIVQEIDLPKDGKSILIALYFIFIKIDVTTLYKILNTIVWMFLFLKLEFYIKSINKLLPETFNLPDYIKTKINNSIERCLRFQGTVPRLTSVLFFSTF